MWQPVSGVRGRNDGEARLLGHEVSPVGPDGGGGGASPERNAMAEAFAKSFNRD